MRKWLRVLLFVLALLAVASASYTIVEFHVARTVSVFRLREARRDLVKAMVDAGRSEEQIRLALEDMDRRYDAQDHQDR